MAKMITRRIVGYKVMFLVRKEEDSTAFGWDTIFISIRDKDKAIRKAKAMMDGKGIFDSAIFVDEMRGMTIDKFVEFSSPIEAGVVVDDSEDDEDEEDVGSTTVTEQSEEDDMEGFKQSAEAEAEEVEEESDFFANLNAGKGQE